LTDRRKKGNKLAMPTKNLYLVASPFQLLNAIAARAHFSDPDAVLVMLHSSDAKNNDQMTRMLDLARWAEVHVVTSKFGMVTYFKAIKLLSRLRASEAKWEQLFIGEYHSHTFHTYCQNLHARQFFNLDDGVSTIELQRNIFAKPTHALKPDTGAKYLAKQIIKTIFGTRENENRSVKFDLFTCFDLDAHDGQTIIKNRYRYLSKRIDKMTIRKDAVYFYGSSISEKGIMSFDSEVAMFTKVSGYFKERGQNLFYIPHRLDSGRKLEFISNLGVQIKRSDWAAEIEPIYSGELPEQVASFFSTALYTLGSIYKFKNIVAFRIPQELLVARGDAISKLYEEFANHMQIVRLQ
jgi:Alpha-2,8-polysialyltransferase (POLYST)